MGEHMSSRPPGCNLLGATYGGTHFTAPAGVQPMGCNPWGNTFHPGRRGALWGATHMGGVFRGRILPQPQGCNLWGGSGSKFYPGRSGATYGGSVNIFYLGRRGATYGGARGVALPTGGAESCLFPEFRQPKSTFMGRFG